MTQHRNRGFALADEAALDRPVLCVVIDTEEEFDWHGPLSRRSVGTCSLRGLARAQAVFRRHRVRPAYLVDHPVASDPRAPEMFGPWLEAGECVLGAQLHAWVTPPFEEVVCPENSFSCNLDEDLERRKLAILTERIRAAFGIAPRIYKAGRYGVDLGRAAMLAGLGYRVDTSVVPFRSFAGSGGGPDFLGYPDRPFWAGPEEHGLFCLPVTQGLVGPLRRVVRRGLVRGIYGRVSSNLHLPGALARLGLLERIMLTPEGTSLEELLRLVETRIRDGHRVFALSMHSTSFWPGAAPYVRDEEDLRDFLDRIDRFLGLAAGRFGMAATDPWSLRERFLRHAPPAGIIGSKGSQCRGPAGSIR